MTGQVIVSLVIAALAVLGAIGSVAALAFRVGTLVGTVNAHITASDADRVRLWEASGKNASAIQRHAEIMHGGRRDGR